MRLFTALDLPSRVQDQIASLRAPNALDARWTQPDQYHITVRFIGDADPDQAARYEDALARIDGPTATCIPYGYDLLPSRRNPSVLIVGLERTETLLALYQTVSDALEGEGLAPEERTYRPHVTLARLNDLPASTVHDFLETRDELVLDSFKIDTLHLYESTLTPDGAIHERRASIPLSP